MQLMWWSLLFITVICHESVLSCWWQFEPGMTWQWQLSGKLNLSYDVEMYDVDLFDTTDAELEALRKSHRLVICYISAGTWENWRTDAHKFPNESLGNPLANWPGEKWLDIRHPEVRKIMSSRIELAVQRGCDGIEPDNIDGYSNNNGLGLTAENQIQYNIWLTNEAHLRNLSIGLKNDVEQVEQLESYFDWALSESCLKYHECDAFKPFLQNNKAVFHVEYVSRKSRGQKLKTKVCKKIPKGFSTLIKLRNLNKWSLPCGDPS